MTFPGLRSIFSRYRPGRWAFTLILVVGATFLARRLDPLLVLAGPFALPFLYFAVVLTIAFLHGMGPAILATIGGALGIAFITVSSHASSENRDLLFKVIFFAAQSLLGAAFIHAARRSARQPPRPPLEGPPPR